MLLISSKFKLAKRSMFQIYYYNFLCSLFLFSFLCILFSKFKAFESLILFLLIYSLLRSVVFLFFLIWYKKTYKVITRYREELNNKFEMVHCILF